MNEERHLQILSELGGMDIIWSTSPIHGNESASLRWFEVAMVDSDRLCLGLSENAYWTAANHKSVVELKSKESYSFFLRILESSLSTIQEKVVQGLIRRKLPPSWADSFPFEEIIIGALESGSEYWVTLALDWVMQYPHSARIQESLFSVIKNGPTQKLRHTAKNLAYSRK